MKTILRTTAQAAVKSVIFALFALSVTMTAGAIYKVFTMILNYFAQ